MTYELRDYDVFCLLRSVKKQPGRENSSKTILFRKILDRPEIQLLVKKSIWTLFTHYIGVFALRIMISREFRRSKNSSTIEKSYRKHCMNLQVLASPANAFALSAFALRIVSWDSCIKWEPNHVLERNVAIVDKLTKSFCWDLNSFCESKKHCRYNIVKQMMSRGCMRNRLI